MTIRFGRTQENVRISDANIAVRTRKALKDEDIALVLELKDADRPIPGWTDISNRGIATNNCWAQ